MVKTGIITVRRKICFPLVAKWRQQGEIIRRTAAASTNPKVCLRYIFRNWFVVERSINPPEAVFAARLRRDFRRSQWNRAVTAILNRVIPDHSDIIRNLDAMLSKCGTNAYRHTVIGTGNCFRKFFAFQKHLFYHLITACIPIISVVNIFVKNRKTVCFHALLIATQTLNRMNMSFTSI